MRGNYPLTRPKLHRVLLDLLRHDEVRLRYKAMRKNEGFVDWDDIMPPTNITIDVDANTNPTAHLSAVVHELLHVAFYPMLVGRMSDEFSEVGILAYERDMYAYIQRSPSRVAKWTAAIEAKLKAKEAAGEPVQG